MLSDLDETAAGEGREAGVGEGLVVVLGETTRIEGVLEVFECQSEVEDSRVY